MHDWGVCLREVSAKETCPYTINKKFALERNGHLLGLTVFSPFPSIFFLFPSLPLSIYMYVYRYIDINLSIPLSTSLHINNISNCSATALTLLTPNSPYSIYLLRCRTSAYVSHTVPSSFPFRFGQKLRNTP